MFNLIQNGRKKRKTTGIFFLILILTFSMMPYGVVKAEASDLFEEEWNTTTVFYQPICEPYTIPEENNEQGQLGIGYHMIKRAQGQQPGEVEVLGSYLVERGNNGGGSLSKKGAETLTIPEKVNYKGYEYLVTRIGEGAFVGADDAFDNMKTIVLPDSLITLGKNCLAKSNIAKITIPRNLTTIEDGALGRCYKLISFEVSSGNSHFSTDGKYLYSKDGTILYCAASSLSGTIQVKEGVKTIEKGAFINCNGSNLWLDDLADYSIGSSISSIDKIIIPKTVTRIGVLALQDIPIIEFKGTTPPQMDYPQLGESLIIVPRSSISKYIGLRYEGTYIDDFAYADAMCDSAYIFDKTNVNWKNPYLVHNKNFTNKLNTKEYLAKSLQKPNSLTQSQWNTIKKQVAAITKDCVTDNEKLYRIYQWFQVNAECKSYSLWSREVSESKLKQYASVYGAYQYKKMTTESCIDLMDAMLRAAGIPSAGIKLSKGLSTSYCNLAYVDGKWRILEPQEEYFILHHSELSESRVKDLRAGTDTNFIYLDMNLECFSAKNYMQSILETEEE